MWLCTGRLRQKDLEAGLGYLVILKKQTKQDKASTVKDKTLASTHAQNLQNLTEDVRKFFSAKAFCRPVRNPQQQETTALPAEELCPL